MYDFLKALALPPTSVWLLQIIGLALVFSRHRRAGMSVIVVATALLYLLSIPLIGDVLGRAAETVHPLPDNSPRLHSAQAIVVLSGGVRTSPIEYGGETVDGITLERLRYAVHLHRVTGLPLLVSGGAGQSAQPFASLMKSVLEYDFQVPVRWEETRSLNTYENAIFSAEILKRDQITTVALVTDAGHMPRALQVFENAGLSVVPAPIGFTGPPQLRFYDFVPQYSGFRDCYYALYELFGRAWYSLRYSIAGNALPQ